MVAPHLTLQRRYAQHITNASEARAFRGFLIVIKGMDQ